MISEKYKKELILKGYYNCRKMRYICVSERYYIRENIYVFETIVRKVGI